MNIDRVVDVLRIELLTALLNDGNGESALSKIDRYLCMAYSAGMDEAEGIARGKRPILWLDDNGIVKKRFISAEQAANYLDINVQGVRDVVCGNQHTAFGYKFKYAEESKSRSNRG